MSGGYTGKLLTIDLSSGTVKHEVADEAVLRNFVSGRGLGIKLLYDRNTQGVEPLSPDNLIVSGRLAAMEVEFQATAENGPQWRLSGVTRRVW